MESKICYITAIYNNETLKSCPKYVKQTIATDFICFTDNVNINNNGWLIDTFPYHKCVEIDTFPYHKCVEIDTFPYHKCVEIDTFPYHKCVEKELDNIINFYKQQYKTKIIPCLKKYDVIIWLDETYELNYEKAAACLINGYNRWKK